MADYTSPFTITNTMLDCVASISEKIGKMSALKNLEAKPHLRKNNRIRSIYSSIFRWEWTNGEIMAYMSLVKMEVSFSIYSN